MLHDLSLEVAHGLLSELPAAVVVALGTAITHRFLNRRAKDKK